MRGHASLPGEPSVCRETFALFVEPQWDATIGPPPGTDPAAIFRGRSESSVIPSLRARLPKVPVAFGDLLRDSSAIYYAHNNPDTEA